MARLEHHSSDQLPGISNKKYFLVRPLAEVIARFRHAFETNKSRKCCRGSVSNSTLRGTGRSRSPTLSRGIRYVELPPKGGKEINPSNKVNKPAERRVPTKDTRVHKKHVMIKIVESVTEPRQTYDDQGER